LPFIPEQKNHMPGDFVEDKGATERKLKTIQKWLDAASVGSVAIPSPIGDVVGLGADLGGMALSKENRTLGNLAGAGLGLLPFVPGPGARKVIEKLGEKGVKALEDSHAIAEQNAAARRVARKPVPQGGYGADVQKQIMDAVKADQPSFEDQMKLARTVMEQQKAQKIMDASKAKIPTTWKGPGVPPNDPRFKMFDEMAQIQRGHPEVAMMQANDVINTRFPNVKGAGVMQTLFEHVGDLTHRIGEKGGYFGTEYVRPKVERALRILENSRDVEDLNAFPHFAERAKYALAHQKVPVYNDVQRAARDAAVDIAQGNLREARQSLRSILETMDSGKWDEVAYAVDPKYADPDRYEVLSKWSGTFK
jgi:hypothetical protein